MPDPLGWFWSRWLKELTVQGHNPPIYTQLRCCMVWFNFTIWRGVLKTCPVTTQPLKNVTDLHTHTHQALTRVRRKVRLQLYSSRVFMTSWHHQARWWSAVSCSVWFSSANRISNNTSSGKTCQWRIELRLAHNSEERKGTQNNECVQEKSRFVRRCVVITTCRQSQFQLRWPVPLLSLHTSVTPDPPHTQHNTNTGLLVTHDVPLNTCIHDVLYDESHTLHLFFKYFFWFWINFLPLRVWTCHKKTSSCPSFNVSNIFEPSINTLAFSF